MTDNRTTELREKLDELGKNYSTIDGNKHENTVWHVGELTWWYDEDTETGKTVLFTPKQYNVTPEQAIAATLENGTQMQPRCVDCGTLLSDELRCTLCAEKLNAKLVSDRDEIYNAGFDNGVKATLHQLDGLLIKTDSAVEIQAWVDEQWKEYES